MPAHLPRALTAGVPPLVEREVELGVLQRVVEIALDGSVGSARVLGAAGVGKTTLVRAILEQTRARGVRCWSTSAGQMEGQVPFGVVRRLLDPPVRALSSAQRADLDAGPARLALSLLWGHQGDRDWPAPPAEADVLHSLDWLLGALAADGPVLLAVDDAQWADEESLIFLGSGSLRDRLADLAVAVVVSARDEAADRTPALSALVADRDAVVIRLEPLSADGVDDVLRDLWGTVPDGIAPAVLEVTGGNPFLVHALADELAGSGRAIDAALVGEAVPASVIDLVVARMAGLSEAEQALARAIAVLDETTLSAASLLVDADVPAETADHLRRTGLLDEGPTLRFRHALLRSAVYAATGPDTRDRLHRAAARTLAADPYADRARAAAHLLESSPAGDAWAVGLLRAAAADAVRLGAPHSAVAILQRALAEPPEPGVVGGVLHDLGMVQLRTLDPGCAATLAESLALADGPESGFPRALALAAAYGLAGRHDDAAGVLEETLHAVAGQGPELEMSLLAAWAAVALQVPRRVADARRRLAPLAGLEGRTPAERQVLVQQVYVAASTNQPATTIKALAERVIGDWESAEQDPESGDWVWPRLFLGRIGAVATACSLADAGYARAEARGSVAGMIAASFVRAFTEEDSGGLVEAEDHYRAMLVHHDGALMIQMLGHCGLAQTLALQGRTGEARDVLAQFPDPLPPETPAGGAALIWAARARLCHAEGDFDGAVSAADELRRLLGELGADSPTWISWRPLTVDALRSLGRLTEARALAREHLELCERSGVPHLVGEALGARAGVAEGPDLAIDLARRGVQLLSPTESLLRLGNAQLTLGALLRRNGSKVAARDHLRVAVELLDRCGASPAAAFAREELAATGVRLPRTALLLTPSERRVAELALAGLSNPEIGARLHVTRKTVETHLSAAYRKLGISGREDLRAEHLVLGR